MGNITNFINNIKSAVFGKDVRQSICDAIEQCYDDAIANGHTDMEVAKARGNFFDLEERLDATQDAINNLASGSPKGAYETYEELIGDSPASGVYIIQSDGHAFSWNKDKLSAIDLGIYQATEISNNSINCKKLDSDLKKIINISIPGFVLTSKKYIDAKNKVVKDHNLSSWSVSSAIFLKRNQTLVFYGKGLETNVGMIATCNSNGELYEVVVASKSSEVEKYTYTALNDEYVMLSGYSENFNKIFVYDIKLSENDFNNNNETIIDNNTIFIDKNDSYLFSRNVTNKFEKSEKIDYNHELNIKVETDGSRYYGWNWYDLKNVELQQDIINKSVSCIIEIKSTTSDELEFYALNQNLTEIYHKKIVDISNEYKKYIIKFETDINTTSLRIGFGSKTSIAENHDLKLRMLGFKVNVEPINLFLNPCTIYDKLYFLKRELIADRFQKKYENNKISILGDSYSTYGGWNPNGYPAWYKENGNTQENNVSHVTQTWWYQLCQELNLSMLVNCSYSGSTICNTGYGGIDVSTKSFIARMKEFVGEQRKSDSKPNIIFVFGGTNDSWANAPIGELKYSNWNDDDFKSVLPAFCYMINYLKLWNPGTKIINIVNTELKSEIIDGMTTACEHYEIGNIILSDISKTNGHPNQERNATNKKSNN